MLCILNIKTQCHAYYVYSTKGESINKPLVVLEWFEYNIIHILVVWYTIIVILCIIIMASAIYNI